MVKKVQARKKQKQQKAESIHYIVKFKSKPGFASALLLSIPENAISFSMYVEDPRRVFLR